MAFTLDGVLVKRAHQKQQMSDKELVEFANCANQSNGYDYFMENFFYIQHPTLGKLKYTPYLYQKRLVDTYHNNRFSIALMPRQTGKCVQGNTNIKIRNKKTGEIKEITMEDFYKMVKNDK